MAEEGSRDGSGGRAGGLWTDLYELTMLAGYVAHDRFERATFELFVRHLPPHRAYLVTAGQPAALDYLLRVGFNGEDLDYLKGLGIFGKAPAAFWDYLRDLRFTGDVWAMPEGTVAFEGEPILRLTAPLPEAQLVETALLSTIVFPTTVATKSARVVEAACCDGRRRPVVEFGARRAHGFEAACLAARAAVLAGCEATSNVEAARRYGLEPRGTMAHSWVLSWRDETEAFTRFAEVFPDHTTALVDTYDTREGVRRAVRGVAKLAAVRLDSGEVARLARDARETLDREGRADTRIFVSGDLNEEQIRALVLEGVPVDAFGVGTDLVTSRDAPALGAVYKLVEVEGPGGPRPVMKTSAGKLTLPGAKQVFRRSGPGGRFEGDVLALASERAPDGAEPLLAPLLRNGRPAGPAEPFERARERVRRQLASLPDALRAPGAPPGYPVVTSEALDSLKARLLQERAWEGSGSRKEART